MATITLTAKDIEARYEDLTASVKVWAHLTTESVGGQPADRKGVMAFVTHHLKLTGPDAEAACDRIMREEGAQITTPEGGEVKEAESYAVNNIRRSQYGVWFGDWMVKACIKSAASRVGLFKKKIGTKGDFAEGGRVYAIDYSFQDNARQIYLLDPHNNIPVKTYYRNFRGRVNTPSGATSVVHDSECAPAGSRFAFELRFVNGKTTERELTDVLALACNCGLGSAKSFECGRFEIDKAIIDIDTVAAKEKK